MKGLLVGLVLGFALGAVVMHAMRGEVEVSQAPPEKDPAMGDPPTAAVRDPASLTSPVARAGPAPSAQPASGPAEQAVLDRYMQREPVKELADAEILRLIERLLTPSGCGRVRVYELSESLVDEVSRRFCSPGGFTVPRTLVEQLLASKGNVPLLNLGARLLIYADPSPTDLLPGLISRDANHLVQRSALQAWIRHGKSRPDFMDVLLVAAKDGNGIVKFRAAKALASAATDSPRAAKWVFETVSGADRHLKGAVIGSLGLLGPEGVGCAAKLVVEREHEPDHTRTLAKILIDAGRTGELLTVLDRDPPTRTVQALVSAVAGAETAQGNEAIRSLAGRFSAIYERLRRTEDADLAEFMSLAARAGEAALLRDIAVSSESATEARRMAIEFAVWNAKLRPLAVEACRSLLRDILAREEDPELLDVAKEALEEE